MEPSAENKTEGEGGESMEEILHSIKKIISEDSDEGGKKAKKNSKSAVKEEKAAEEVPGSDVLELTEVVQDDGSIKNVNAIEEPKPAVANKDVLSQIDEAVGPVAQAKPEMPAAPAATKPKEQKPMPSSAPGDPMLSDDAVAAVSASVEKLKKSSEPPPVMTTPFPNFESGNSVEAIVAGMLRPMIKDWLDKNLPAIVERIVEQEIRRITK